MGLEHLVEIELLGELGEQPRSPPRTMNIDWKEVVAEVGNGTNGETCLSGELPNGTRTRCVWAPSSADAPSQPKYTEVVMQL